MAAPVDAAAPAAASAVPQENTATKVDPAATAYIRRVVAALEGKSFDDACEHQIVVTDEAADILAGRPERLSALPHAVASAMDAVEELLGKRSPTLVAYAREEIRDRRVEQEEKVNEARDRIRTMDALISAIAGCIASGTSSIQSARDTMRRMIVQHLITFGGGRSGWLDFRAASRSLQRQIRDMNARERDLLDSMERLEEWFLYFIAEIGGARARVEAEKAVLDALPVVDGDWMDDVSLLLDSSERFGDSVRVLREFATAAE